MFSGRAWGKQEKKLKINRECFPYHRDALDLKGEKRGSERNLNRR